MAEQKPPPRERFRFWELMAVFAFVLGAVAIGVYGWSVAAFIRVSSTLLLVGSAAWLSGSVLGFLFGVPRFQTDAERRGALGGPSGFIPNTNLEQISDWLTKIIIGATLVQLNTLAGAIGGLCTTIGTAVGTQGAATVAGAVLIFYFATGFMWGYLWCSLRIFREMADLMGSQLQAFRKAGGPDPTP